MDYNDFHELFRRNAEVFNASGSLTDFIYNIETSDGFRRHLMKYAAHPYSWANKYFATVKHHPKDPPHRALLVPWAHTVTDLFTHASLQGGAGLHFISDLRAKGFAIGGYLGGHNGHRVFPDGSVVMSRGGGTWQHAHVAFTPQAKATIDTGPVLYGQFSLEAVQWDDGRVLIVGNNSDHIGHDWVALLDPGASIIPLFPEADQELQRSTDAAAESYIEKHLVRGEDGVLREKDHD